MSDAVLDASVVVKWFHSDGEAHLEAARLLRGAFERGELRVFVPPLLWLEIVNVAARRWRISETQLAVLARSLEDLGFEAIEPEIGQVARWAARGLTAYDAAYVAVAEQAGAQLITDDEEIIRIAPQIATALSATTRAPEGDPDETTSS